MHHDQTKKHSLSRTLRGDTYGELVQFPLELLLVEDSGCELLYLPTCPPDLNPIGHLFAKVETFIKNLRPDTVANLVLAFRDAIKTLIPENVRKSFDHCGYQVRR